MNPIEILGTVAAILTTSGFVPQVYKTWRNKSTGDISLAMYTILLIGVLLWFIYGFAIHSFPIIIANGITGFLLFLMILLKLRYR